MIEESIIDWLNLETDAGSRVFTGLRAQGAALPSLVVRVESAERAALGVAPALRVYTVTLQALAETETEAHAVATAAVAALIPNAATDGATAVQTAEVTIEPPDVFAGEESATPSAIVNLELYARL